MENPLNPKIPNADRFRAWLRSALDSVDIPASHLSRLAGLSVNTVGRFVKSGDITLRTASSLEVALRDYAAEHGKTLPRLEADTL